MNKQWKTKWLKALRSNEYVQGKGRLVKPNRYYDKFCCLGVLCDVLGEEFDKNSYGQLGVAINGGGLQTGQLPHRLLKKVSMGASEQHYLIRMNDGGKTFTEIADHIETHF